MIRSQTISDAPYGINVPQIAFLDRFQILILDISSKFIDDPIDSLEILRLPNNIMYCQHQAQVGKGAHAELELFIVCVSIFCSKFVHFFENLSREEPWRTLKSDTLIFTTILKHSIYVDSFVLRVTEFHGFQALDLI